MSRIIGLDEWGLTIQSFEGREHWKQQQDSLVLELIQAVSQGDITGVENCLKKGAPINRALKQERTALSVAASQNNLSMIDFLLKNRASVTARFSQGRDAAWVAMEHGKNEAFEILISLGVSLSLRVNEEGNYTRLIAATRLSNVFVVRSLAYKKVKLNEQDSFGRTALHHNFAKIPYESDDLEIARILLKMGGNPDVEDQDGITATEMATSAEQYALLEGRELGVVADEAMHRQVAPPPPSEIHSDFESNPTPDPAFEPEPLDLSGLDMMETEPPPGPSEPRPRRKRL